MELNEIKLNSSDLDRNQFLRCASPELHPSWHSSALAESRAARRSKAKSCRRGFAMRHRRAAPLASHPPATKLGPGEAMGLVMTCFIWIPYGFLSIPMDSQEFEVEFDGQSQSPRPPSWSAQRKVHQKDQDLLGALAAHFGATRIWTPTAVPKVPEDVQWMSSGCPVDVGIRTSTFHHFQSLPFPNFSLSC